jgi:hypothetical protein
MSSAASTESILFSFFSFWEWPLCFYSSCFPFGRIVKNNQNPKKRRRRSENNNNKQLTTFASWLSHHFDFWLLIGPFHHLVLATAKWWR